MHMRPTISEPHISRVNHQKASPGVSFQSQNLRKTKHTRFFHCSHLHSTHTHPFFNSSHLRSSHYISLILVISAPVVAPPIIATVVFGKHFILARDRLLISSKDRAGNPLRSVVMPSANMTVVLGHSVVDSCNRYIDTNNHSLSDHNFFCELNMVLMHAPPAIVPACPLLNTIFRRPPRILEYCAKASLFRPAFNNYDDHVRKVKLEKPYAYRP